MGKMVIERLLKLFAVKSLVTIMLTITFMVLAIRGVIPPEKLYEVYMVIISFYFCTQALKRE